jgi:hypothetical protein
MFTQYYNSNNLHNIENNLSLQGLSLKREQAIGRSHQIMQDGKSATTRFLFLPVAKHKDAQSGHPSRQVTIYNKC